MLGSVTRLLGNVTRRSFASQPTRVKECFSNERLQSLGGLERCFVVQTMAKPVCEHTQRFGSLYGFSVCPSSKNDQSQTLNAFKRRRCTVETLPEARQEKLRRRLRQTLFEPETIERFDADDGTESLSSTDGSSAEPATASRLHRFLGRIAVSLARPFCNAYFHLKYRTEMAQVRHYVKEIEEELKDSLAPCDLREILQYFDDFMGVTNSLASSLQIQKAHIVNGERTRTFLSAASFAESIRNLKPGEEIRIELTNSKSLRLPYVGVSDFHILVGSLLCLIGLGIVITNYPLLCLIGALILTGSLIKLYFSFQQDSLQLLSIKKKKENESLYVSFERSKVNSWGGALLARINMSVKDFAGKFLGTSIVDSILPLNVGVSIGPMFFREWLSSSTAKGSMHSAALKVSTEKLIEILQEENPLRACARLEAANSNLVWRMASGKHNTKSTYREATPCLFAVGGSIALNKIASAGCEGFIQGPQFRRQALRQEFEYTKYKNDGSTTHLTRRVVIENYYRVNAHMGAYAGVGCNLVPIADEALPATNVVQGSFGDSLYGGRERSLGGVKTTGSYHTDMQTSLKRKRTAASEGQVGESETILKERTHILFKNANQETILTALRKMGLQEKQIEDVCQEIEEHARQLIQRRAGEPENLSKADKFSLINRNIVSELEEVHVVLTSRATFEGDILGEDISDDIPSPEEAIELLQSKNIGYKKPPALKVEVSLHAGSSSTDTTDFANTFRITESSRILEKKNIKLIKRKVGEPEVGEEKKGIAPPYSDAPDPSSSKQEPLELAFHEGFGS